LVETAVFAVSSRPRRLLGWLLFCLASAAILIGVRLEWGLAAMMVLPAMVLMVPAAALSEFRRLRVDGDALLIETGGGRRQRLPLAGCSLELLPLAGCWAVLCHQGGREVALATWLRRGRAQALCAWLDHAAPAGAWPRLQRARAAGDR
jgi:hypothetical protein